MSNSWPLTPGNLLLVATAKQVLCHLTCRFGRFCQYISTCHRTGKPYPRHQPFPIPFLCPFVGLGQYACPLPVAGRIVPEHWSACLGDGDHSQPWILSRLGFSPSGEPLVVPAVQLIILPIMSILLYVTGFIAGLYFFRWEEYKTLAFILWGAGAFTSFLFLISVMLLLNTHL